MFRSEAHIQPMAIFQIGRAYLNAADLKALTRTGQFVIDKIARHKRECLTHFGLGH